MLQEQEITVKINKRESVNKSNLRPITLSEINILKSEGTSLIDLTYILHDKCNLFKRIYETIQALMFIM